MTALTYLSGPWRDEVEKRLKADLSPEKMNFISSSMSNIYTNCPDGKNHFLFFQFEAGIFKTVLTGTQEPPKAEFRITGDYQVFAKISRSELGSQKALMTGKLKLKGNMIKALKLASVADRINKVVATIDAQY
ncbi:MAG: SCP2 sterol-binding domain-containing protein [Desulfobacterium sp.]|nr:SCP2 sterol-binding domain-containing protein [Desulfobacterium sp.]